ncbi:MAG TPA: tetratricopeptide repeat protein [Arenicellales bacterium]|nr:tetratricopeptide repeat protein [Arenicellales bacterium]
MAGLHLSEDEQSERIKAWWKENGTSVIAGTVLGIAVIVGVNYWRSYQAEQAETAAELYQELMNGQAESAAGAGRTLIDEYAGTPYAGKAALLLAAMAVDDGDLEGAAEHLDWAMSEAADPADRKVARLRAARVALSRDDPDAAANLLSAMQAGGYESEYRELLGDIAMARGETTVARREYESALAALPQQSGYSTLLNAKLDAATGASQ